MDFSERGYLGVRHQWPNVVPVSGSLYKCYGSLFYYVDEIEVDVVGVTYNYRVDGVHVKSFCWSFLVPGTKRLLGSVKELGSCLTHAYTHTHTHLLPYLLTSLVRRKPRVDRKTIDLSSVPDIYYEKQSLSLPSKTMGHQVSWLSLRLTDSDLGRGTEWSTH